MSIGIGIDIGSVSIKCALIGESTDSKLLERIAGHDGFFIPASDTIPGGMVLVVTEYKRIKGSPLTSLREILSSIGRIIGSVSVRSMVTGSGGKLASTLLSAPVLNEFSAIVETINVIYPDVRTVFEMGGETSKYILLGRNAPSEKLSIIDYGTNGDCAAGTGSFMDQQSSRLKFAIEDVGSVVAKASKAAQIAGRCSVFAKSDMIHAQQRGYKPDEVLRGLCNAVARNFKSAITRGKKVQPPVAFIGGVSLNSGMLGSIKEVFNLEDSEIFVPGLNNWMGAVGCALRARHEGMSVNLSAVSNENREIASEQMSSVAPLTLDNVRLLRESTEKYTFQKDKDKIPAYLGVDIGSVSTNLVVIDSNGAVMMEIYVRTQARPIEVVRDGLKEIAREIGDRIDIQGVGTTGSGRELIGILIGADTINDEITAHKTGALHISRRMLRRDVDTIFEIGGQDSKFISIEDGIVVDFTMNDACAAGTGSFLEEQAETLDVKIINEFAKLAFTSQQPIRLGERCTVFMGKDVNSYLQRGAEKKDIIAGLTYSVVHNYLNRVVRDRKIGNTVFFQGGTAYNDAVAAAFATVTGKEIIVPPHNGVIGAIGAALLAKDKMSGLKEQSTFKGFDLMKVDYNLREFTCKFCTNFCSVQEFTVDGEKTYWGDKCSERYRKRKKVAKTPVIADLFKIREELLRQSYNDNGNSGPVVGIPFSMYMYDRLPFFATYLSKCGFCTFLSEPTNTIIANAGIEAVVAEPCYPITVAHGHIKSLIDNNVDFVFLPNVINSETDAMDNESYVCVWGSTLPFIALHCPSFSAHKNKILKPTVHFRDGADVVKRELFEVFGKLGIKKSVSNAAVDDAFVAQSAFRKRLWEIGEDTIRLIKESGEKAIVLVGRPYNIYDRAINLSVAMKLSSSYGINIIPMEFINVAGVDISDVNDNMYWNYGRKIIQIAVKLSNEPHFDIIYITNFKCGPDSFVKQYIRSALGRPFLALQFDGHSNDAGVMTRCEAYLDSKGFLRTWEGRIDAKR